jgi:hypothetical protein
MSAANVEVIASICHEANRAWCVANGDFSQQSWADAPDWQKESAVAGVKAHLTHDLSPRESHYLWMEHKTRDGWVYGSVKDEVRRTHPCMVPYEELPVEQRIKDSLFKAIVDTFKEHRT